MAIGDPYADVADLAERLGSDDIQPSFPSFVDAASRVVEAFCRRQFNKQTDATARRFRPLDWRRLPVDDFHTVTGLVVDVAGTVWDAATFDPQPWNGMLDGQPGWPFFDLIAVGRYWSPCATTTVTAQWGWPAVPAAVKLATLDVASAMWFSGGGGQSGPISAETVAGYSVQYATGSVGSVSTVDAPPELRRVVPYRRKRWGVA